MDDIVLSRALRAQGYDSDEIRRLRETGRADVASSGGVHAGIRDRAECRTATSAADRGHGAVAPRRCRDRRSSAAVLHGLPIWASAVSQVHLTRDRMGGGKIRSQVRVHGARLADPGGDDHRRDRRDLPSAARCSISAARSRSSRQWLPVTGRSRTDSRWEALQQAMLELGRSRGFGRRGEQSSCWMAEAKVRASQSSRVRIISDGLPAPEPQLVIRSSNGAFVARVNFGWKEHQTVGEFDGKIKYGRLLKPGQRIGMSLPRRRSGRTRSAITAGRSSVGCGRTSTARTPWRPSPRAFMRR